MRHSNQKDLPLPFRNKRRAVQVEIDESLYEAFEQEVKRNDAFKRDIIEWGMKMYILRSNQELASKLGIIDK